MDAKVAIVGAGPIGLEFAVALKRAGIDYLHFDAKQIGYTISWFAPETHFFSSNERIAIAGVPLVTVDQSKATREQYLAYLRSVATQFDLKIHAYEPVTGIKRLDTGFELTTHPRAGETHYRASNIVLAIGGTARPRKLGIPGENLAHVSHYFADPHTYFGQRVHIVGGKNSAVEAALRCDQAGAKVSMSHRRSEFDSQRIKYWLWPEISGFMKSGRIPVYFNTRPVEIRPDKIILARDDGSKIEQPVDFVLALVGYEADLTLCKLAGVELTGDSQSPRYDPNTMETNIPGIFVAGTATAGTQSRFAVFLENCHVHVERILASLTGHQPPAQPRLPDSPES